MEFPYKNIVTPVSKSTEKRVLYLHGFGSGGATQTAKNIAKDFINDDDVTIYTMDIPPYYDAAMKAIEDKIIDLDINIVIGTSLGGFYALKMYELFGTSILAIAINPAIKPSYSLKAFANEKTPLRFFTPRANGIMDFMFTSNDADKFVDIDDNFWDRMNHIMVSTSKIEGANLYIFYSINDEVLGDTYNLYKESSFGQNHPDHVMMQTVNNDPMQVGHRMSDEWTSSFFIHFLRNKLNSI